MKKKQTFTFPEFVVGILSEDKRKLEYVYALKKKSDAKAYAEATLIAHKQLEALGLFAINYCIMLNNHDDDLELEATYIIYETLRIDEDGNLKVSTNNHERFVILTAFDFSNNQKGKKLSPAPHFYTARELDMELSFMRH